MRHLTLCATLSILALAACSGAQQRQEQDTAKAQTQQIRQQTADGILDARVAAAIASDAGANAFKVTPHAQNGVVTLTGTVRTADIEHTIIKSVTAVPGVHQVISKISVGSD